MPESIYPAIAYGLLAIASAAAVYFSIPALMPLFRRYALARPNARSSHVVPVPQGGGIPVIAALIILSAAAFLLGIAGNTPADTRQYYVLTLAGALALALLGANDDIRPMPAATRLVMQAIIAAIVVFSAPEAWRVLPLLPQMVERALVALAFVWMINLTNFMDGIDGMVVAGVIPALVGIVLFAFVLAMPFAGLVAATLAGGIIGFAPHNRHPAHLYLGDAGSLPIGLVLAALLFHLAATVSLAAALLLPLYFVLDATTTLFAGLVARHDVSKAHRRHAYQRAVDGGWPVPRVTRNVWILNCILVALAALCIATGSGVEQCVLVAFGAGLTTLVLYRFRNTP